MSRKNDIELLARGVMVRSGRVLLCRNRKKGHLYLPGGHIEFGESARSALRREIKEEIGFPCAVGRFLGASEHTFVVKGERTCEINLVFEMDVRGAKPGKAVPSREKKLEFVWVPLAKLAGARVEPRSLAKALPEWVKGHRSAHWASSF